MLTISETMFGMKSVDPIEVAKNQKIMEPFQYDEIWRIILSNIHKKWQ
jgi:hypothetical protein